MIDHVKKEQVLDSVRDSCKKLGITDGAAEIVKIVAEAWDDAFHLGVAKGIGSTAITLK
jgi:hypothetical protein